MTSVINNLITIQKRIEQAASRVNRNHKDVNIIAVTKQVSTQRAEETIEAGIVNLGENRPEGLQEKKAHLQNKAKWHYIGSLQTRKVKQIIHDVDYLHSLDRLSLAEEINKRAQRTIDCFVQVNVSGEESKHGVRPEELRSFIEQLSSLKHIRVIGLMTMAPNTENEQTIRDVFKGLKKLQLEVASQQYAHAPCEELSMGMSNDYEIAVEEGATYVRIGTALVGEESGESE